MNTSIIINQHVQTAGRSSKPSAATRIVAAGLLCVLSSVASAMGYADRTPGQAHLTAGIEAYEAGQYVSARGRFERAAHWADKVAQFNLGVMHLNGQGMEPDPARAWAWFELAAERRYPSMVEVADRLWSMLDDAQRDRARRIHDEELLEHYGDAQAVPRTARHMRREMRGATGSRVGARSANLQVIEVENVYTKPEATFKIAATGRVYSGADFYDPAKFDFHNVVATESFIFDAEERGEVSLGAFRLIDEESDEDSTSAENDSMR